MKNFLLPTITFITSLIFGYLIGYNLFKPETPTEPKETLEYHIGYGAALDTFMYILNSHIEDTNKVTKVQFIDCVTCDSTELSIDTVTYNFYPKKMIVK
jgi:hypothetical protein